MNISSYESYYLEKEQLFNEWYQYIYTDIWIQYGDPDVNAYLGGPWYIPPIIAIYLSFIYYFGPRIMADKKPYDLKRTMQIYNLINVYLSGFLFAGSLIGTRFMFDCWGCHHELNWAWMGLNVSKETELKLRLTGEDDLT